MGVLYSPRTKNGSENFPDGLEKCTKKKELGLHKKTSIFRRKYFVGQGGRFSRRGRSMRGLGKGPPVGR